MMDSRNLPATDSLRTPTIPFTLAFRSGGFDNRPIPAMNQASPQLGQNPYMKRGSDRYLNSGTSVSRTDLGAYRMGSATKVPSAIYEGEFSPPNPEIIPGRPAVEFLNVGFNTFQPDNDDEATHALLKAMGNQQFKATFTDPFSDYFNEQRLAREINDIERTASVPEHQLAREIMRNVIAERKEGNELDTMRKMIDNGMTAEDAENEIDNIRRFNALQASKNPDDRMYQSKLLLTRIAKSRGQLSSVNEPLDNHSAIMSPQPNELMASAMGDVGAGFGNSPIDTNKIFKTPEYYKKFLRKSTLTQEQADRDTAIGNQIATEGFSQNIPDDAPTSGAVTASVLSAEDRYRQIEQNTLNAASKLEGLRRRGQTLRAPMPSLLFAPNVIANFYNSDPGTDTLFSNKNADSLTLADTLSAINNLVANNSSLVARLKFILTSFKQDNSATLRSDSKDITVNEMRDVLKKLTNFQSYDFQFPSIVNRTRINQRALKQDIITFADLNQQEILAKQAESRRSAFSRKNRSSKKFATTVEVPETSTIQEINNPQPIRDQTVPGVLPAFQEATMGSMRRMMPDNAQLPLLIKEIIQRRNRSRVSEAFQALRDYRPAPPPGADPPADAPLPANTIVRKLPTMSNTTINKMKADELKKLYKNTTGREATGKVSDLKAELKKLINP